MTTDTTAYSPADDQPRETAPFSFGDLAQYVAVFGLVGLLGVLGWFMMPVLNGGRLIGFAMMTACLLFALAAYLDLNARLRPAGVFLVSLATCATPLAVVGLQQATGLAPIDDLTGFPGRYGTLSDWLSSPWLPVILLTGIAALVAVVAYRYRFLVLILIAAAWALLTQVMPMLVAAILENAPLPQDPVVGLSAFASMEALVYFLFGLLLMFCGAWTDLATKREYAFWLYVTGAAFGWYFGHTMLQDPRHQLILAAMIYFILPWFAAYLRRRVLLIVTMAAGLAMVWMGMEQLKPMVMERQPIEPSLWLMITVAAGVFLLAISWPAAKFFMRLEKRMNKSLPAALNLLRPAIRRMD